MTRKYQTIIRIEFDERTITFSSKKSESKQKVIEELEKVIDVVRKI